MIFHDIAAVSPTLCIQSPEKRCGKTRNLDILACLVYRPIATANITPSTLFRVIDHFVPTLLIHEADTFLLNGPDELRGLLNAGLYRSTAFVVRCQAKVRIPKMFSVWCRKTIAVIGRLPTTLQDRCIPIAMQRRAPGERIESFRYEKIFHELEPLRRRVARWASDNRDKLGDADSLPLPENLMSA